MIASHYAEPLQRHLKRDSALRANPSDEAEQILHLDAGAEVRILDKRGEWAWGYGGGLVGYLPAAALGA